MRTGGIARENTIAIISSDTLVLVDSRDSRGEDRGLETSVERVTGQRNVYLLTVQKVELWKGVRDMVKGQWGKVYRGIYTG